MNTIARVLLSVLDALEAADIPHAVGGALALAYCIHEPRATRDVDINVFLPPSRAGDVLGSLPPETPHTRADIDRVERDGQVRLWWQDDVPVDLFFDVHEFHAEAAAGVRRVPFHDRDIPVLGCAELVIFKSLYGRTQDWADIEAILGARTIDCAETLRRLQDLLGDEHPSTVRLRALCHTPS